MVSQTRDAAIVGVHEYPSRKVDGKVSSMQIKAASAARALADAGLTWKDVDAIYDAGEGGGGMSGLTIAEYFGLKPNVIDTTAVGGSSYEFHAAHAKRDIAAGKARVALLTYGSNALSQRDGDRHRRTRRLRDAPGREHGFVRRHDAGVELRDGRAPPHASVRHDERTARGNRHRDAAARDAQSGSGCGDDRARLSRHSRNHDCRTSSTRR